MQPSGTPDVPDFKLPSTVGPSLSYSSVDRAVAGAGRVVQSLVDKVAREAIAGIQGSAQVGASLESKILQYLAERYNPAEALHDGLKDTIENSLAGGMAPAAAALEDLASAGLSVGRQRTPSSGQSAATPAASRPAYRSADLVQSGDASKGLSAGALSAKENELGVDPDIQGASITVTGQPPGDGRAAATPAMSQAAQDWLAQCLQNDPSGASCQPSYQVWAPPQPLSADQMAAGLTNPCVVLGGGASVPSGWIPCGNPTGDLDAALAFAATCTAAGGRCPPGSAGAGGPMPTQPSPPPTSPTGPPTGPPPPPPPPPPPCCPPVTIPPCPSLVLPECLNIDLCDWQKFCDTLTNCLSAAQPSPSQVDDFLADWPQEEVDPDEPGNFSDYLGSLADDYLSYNSIDDALAAITKLDPDMEPASILQANPFGPDVPPIG